MKKVLCLILACSVFVAGCDRRESKPAPASLPGDENGSSTVAEAPVLDVNSQELSPQVEEISTPVVESFDWDLDSQPEVGQEGEKTREPDVVFVPTPQDVVEKMLELVNVQSDDLLYDLGCGDGRIVVTAAKKYGCKAIGYDIDPERIKESLENVADNQVEDLVTIEQKDIFTLDLSQANVVTLYLLPSLNVKLIPQLEKLKPGSRIVSHDFAMKGVKPDKVLTLISNEDQAEHKVYLWTTPLKKREKRKRARDAGGLREEVRISAPEIEDQLQMHFVPCKA